MNNPLPEMPAFLRRKFNIVVLFAAVHVIFLLLLVPRIADGQTYGDVELYREWAFQGINEGIWQGIDVSWVYPIGAMFPIVAAAAFGYELYMLGWFILCAILNLGALLMLLNGKVRYGWQSAYLWILLTAILGPLVFSRIDGISAPIVVAGLVLVRTRPGLASLLLSVATWIKVWPAAVILALVSSSRHWFKIVAAGLAVTASMAIAVVAGGGARNLAGFIQAQGERGMQLEAPLTTPGLWQAVLQVGAYIHPNTDIDTMEIRGSMANSVSALMNPLLSISVLVIVLLIFLGARRGADRQDLFLVGGLALVLAMIVFNKVGSPQFMIWLAAVICVGAATKGWDWTVPIVLVVCIALLTTLVYPLLYVQLLTSLNPGAAALLTMRNLSVLLLFAWTLRQLGRMVSRSKPDVSELQPATVTRAASPVQQ